MFRRGDGGEESDGHRLRSHQGAALEADTGGVLWRAVQFVPFYFCPRSPMLYTTNRGATGRPVGCQRTILHLVSRVSVGIGLGRAWAVSDGNAGAFHTWFAATLDAIKTLDWAAIRATDWRGKTHQKSAGFLVADFFPWTGIHAIGCHNSSVAKQVQDLVNSQHHRPAVSVEPAWYY